MPNESPEQKKTVGCVMHEFKHGKLERSRGDKVRKPRRAVAIALSEAGASDQQSPPQNKRQYNRTKSKERHGETAQQQKEGASKQALYAEAAKRGIAGRSHMNKGGAGARAGVVSV